MDLGTLMSLGDIPFHYMTDRFGDQVALPCTERNLTSDLAQATLMRGFMPVLWMKGRDEIRLGSFRSLGGDEIIGPWSGEVPAPRKMPGGGQVSLKAELQAGGDDSADVGIEDDDTDDDDDDFMADFDDGGMDDDDDDGDLDDLLAGFDDDGDDDDGGFDDDDDEMDPELAALLEGL